MFPQIRVRVCHRGSADALTDERRGLVFPARIRITHSRLRGIDQRLQSAASNANPEPTEETPMPASGRRLSASDTLALLSPGMAAQVEVITGRRSVLSYLLSPITRATSEAGRER